MAPHDRLDGRDDALRRHLRDGLVEALLRILDRLAAEGLVARAPATPADPGTARVAVVMPVYHEDASLSLSLLSALADELAAEGMAEQVVRVLAPMGMIFDATSPWVPGSA